VAKIFGNHRTESVAVKEGNRATGGTQAGRQLSAQGGFARAG
jgi:hypothetical protein